MVWADMKAYVASRFCKNLNEVKVAIFEYKRTLTPEKCARFISDLKKVYNISLFWIIRELFYYFIKVIPVVIAKNGGWSK